MELLYFLVSEKSASKFHTLMQIVWLFRFTTYFCVNNLKKRRSIFVSFEIKKIKIG